MGQIFVKASRRAKAHLRSQRKRSGFIVVTTSTLGRSVSRTKTKSHAEVLLGQLKRGSRDPHSKYVLKERHVIKPYFGK